MATRIVLDSTAIAAIFFQDPMSDKVEREITRYDEFYTLDLAYAEVCNVAWKRVRIFKEDLSDSVKSLKAALEFIQDNCKVLESKDALQEALDFALDNDIAAYDAIFAVAAVSLRTRVLSTDERLFRKMRLQKSKRARNLIMLPPGDS